MLLIIIFRNNYYFGRCYNLDLSCVCYRSTNFKAVNSAVTLPWSVSDKHLFYDKNANYILIFLIFYFF